MRGSRGSEQILTDCVLLLSQVDWIPACAGNADQRSASKPVSNFKHQILFARMRCPAVCCERLQREGRGRGIARVVWLCWLPSSAGSRRRNADPASPRVVGRRPRTGRSFTPPDKGAGDVQALGCPTQGPGDTIWLLASWSSSWCGHACGVHRNSSRSMRQYPPHPQVWDNFTDVFF